MQFNRILEIIQANCTVMPSQPSGVVYVFDKDELTSVAELIFNEMQLNRDTPPQLNKRDVSRSALIQKYSDMLTVMKDNRANEAGYLSDVENNANDRLIQLVAEFITDMK